MMASVRFVVGFWWLFCIVIVATYSGNLIAFLAIDKYNAPFETLKEMAQAGEFKFGTIGGTSFEAIMQVLNFNTLKFFPTKSKIVFVF